MEKIRLNVVGLTSSHAQSGNYLIILKEELGKRNLHLVIGAAEAQAIAVELENMKPQRPLTHDLFKSLCQSYDIEISEVLIYNLVQGIYYAKLISKMGDKIIEIDSRSSDAIALAVRFNAPIYTLDFILKGEEASGSPSAKENKSKTPTKKPEKSIPELEEELNRALEEENYERASEIRDKIKKLSQDN